MSGTPAIAPVAAWLRATLAAATGRPCAILDVDPTGTLPAIVIRGVPTGGARPDGARKVATIRSSWQIDSIATTALAAMTLADAVTAALGAVSWPVELPTGEQVTQWDLTLSGAPQRRPADPRNVPFVPHTITLEVTR